MEIDAVLEVEAGDPQIAIDFLLANVNLSKSRLKTLMNRGGVWRVSVDGDRQRIRRAMTDIFVGEQIEIFYDEGLLAAKPLKAELILDRGQYSVWNKPIGMSIDGDDWGDFNSFRRAIDYQFTPVRDIYWLMALDYDASGLVVIAHTRKAALAFSEDFQPNGFQMAHVHYRADVVGNLAVDGTVDTPLDGNPARTQIKTVRYDDKPNRTVIDIWPETGQTEQIRRHLSALGYSVAGDQKYGSDCDESDVLHLRCVELSFICPVLGEKQHFSLVK